MFNCDNMNYSKLEFKKLSSIFRALDNETKLSILSLISEEGAKSVTDISKALRINFSTAHKYLEDLENAGLVKSRQETQNRLKRMFSVQDFNLNLSPEGINSNAKKIKKGFKVVTEGGHIQNFSEEKFMKQYVEGGLPQCLISTGINYLKRQVYDGITLIEIKYLFKEYLKNNMNLISKTISSVEENDTHSRTFGSILRLMHPDALKKHMDGDIFISNLRYPKLRNFVVDIRGLAVHGLEGQVATNLQELLMQIIKLIDGSKDDTQGNFSLSDFNYMIAPYINPKKPAEYRESLTKFFNILRDTDFHVYLEIDLGETPDFMKKLPIKYSLPHSKVNEKTSNYALHKKTASEVAKTIVDILKDSSFSNVIPIFKSWSWKGEDLNLKVLDKFYFANMQQNNVDERNVSFIGRLNRFGSRWKGWPGTVRVGEMQNITLNLPRVALNSNSTDMFFENLSKLVEEVIEYQFSMAELAVADFTRNHHIVRKSVQKVQWNYLRLEDVMYSLSIIGLNETVHTLSGKHLANNPELGELILKRIDDLIRNRHHNIRIALKEEPNPLIADRFHYLDSQKNKLKIKKYGVGIGCTDWDIASRMHKYLPAGRYTTTLKKDFEIKKTLNSGISFIRVI